MTGGQAIGARFKPGTRATWPLFVYGMLVALAALTLVPLVWMLLAAFKSPTEVLQVPPSWWPREWHPENFRVAWNAVPFGRFILNTAFMSGGVAFVETATSALAAYAFARIKFRGRDVLFLAYLATLMVPRQVTVIPQFILMRELNWVDSYQGLILPQAFTAFGTFMLRQFFLTIPGELEDAARVDGASRLQFFRRILLPLSVTALATLFVLSFIFHWNYLLWPLIISNSETTTPVSVGIQLFQGQYVTEWHLLMAAATLATVPVVFLYVFMQKWVVRGIAETGFGGF